MHTHTDTKAFADYTIAKGQWSPMAENAMADRIAAELVEMGCEPKAARIAGGSFMAFRSSPDFGLGGVRDGIAAAHARVALNAWIAAKIDAALMMKVAA